MLERMTSDWSRIPGLVAAGVLAICVIGLSTGDAGAQRLGLQPSGTGAVARSARTARSTARLGGLLRTGAVANRVLRGAAMPSTGSIGLRTGRAATPRPRDRERGQAQGPTIFHHGIQPYYLPRAYHTAWSYWHPFAYANPWGRIEASQPLSNGNRAPPPDAFEPRLGLTNNAPYAWNIGLRLPVDGDPLYTYDLGPFRGVVRSGQKPLRNADGRVVSGADSWGIELLKAGKFKEAGRLLARGFRDTDDPRYPLYLVEALFALGKNEHASLVLKHALALDGAFDHLPEDVASHFPSQEAFQAKLDALLKSVNKNSQLVAAYLQLFGKDGSAGLDALLEVSERDAAVAEGADRDGEEKKSGSDGELAARLYRHYLAKAFSGDDDE